MQKNRSLLALILVLVIAAIVALVNVPFRLGLDLQGGSQLTLLVRPSEEVPQITSSVMEAVQSVVRNRVDALGVSEPIVQSVGTDQILVQLPGVSDPEQAERVLGGTAVLEFREESASQEIRAQLDVRIQEATQIALELGALQESGEQGQIAEKQAEFDRKREEIQELNLQLYEKTPLTGSNLEDAYPEPAQAGAGAWNVGLVFDNEGADLFAQLTQNLAGTGRTLGIFLDDQLISSPTVPAEFATTGITGGRAVIQGNFAVQQANELAVQLRGGALPVPVEIVENRTVGATLGRDSIVRSIYAGIGGLVLVLIFMVAYYRLPGVIADLSLIIYALLTLASFSLLGVISDSTGDCGIYPQYWDGGRCQCPNF